MKSSWERIKDHFEATAKCRHGNKPRVNHEGCTWVEIDGCKCESVDGEGIPLSQFLAEWQERFA